MTVELLGYRYSVYSWVARLALHEKGVDYTWSEVDPFSSVVPQHYTDLHPFNRVPTLVHDGFAVYETGAITRYVDEAFPGPRLQPDAPQARARQNQILSIVDNYGYWPLVRQVFSHGVFRPRVGDTVDPAELRAGLETSKTVLSAVDRLADESGFLVGDGLSLADVHLFPMVAYFAMVPDASTILRQREKLMGWYDHMSARAAVAATRPGLPDSSES